MPSRGRRRGSSQNNLNRVSEAPIRRSSTSRGPRTGLLTLRRSTRLIELLATEEAEPSRRPAVNPSRDQVSSTDRLHPAPQDPSIAREPQQHHSSTSIGHWKHDQALGTQQSLWMNGELERTNTEFNMRIVVEPPNQARPGHVLCPPLVMSLEIRTDRESSGLRPIDPTLLWALVSIVSEDDATCLAPPRSDLLIGTPVDSVHPLTPHGHEREIGYVAFPNLAIREPGRYRLRVSLFRMNAIGGPDAASFEGGINLQSLSSRVIDVAPTAVPPSIGASPLRNYTV